MGTYVKLCCNTTCYCVWDVGGPMLTEESVHVSRSIWDAPKYIAASSALLYRHEELNRCNCLSFYSHEEINYWSLFKMARDKIIYNAIVKLHGVWIISTWTVAVVVMMRYYFTQSLVESCSILCPGVTWCIIFRKNW